jgi:hypothetical protein
MLTSPAPFPIGTSDVIGRTLTPEPERELPRDPVAYVRGELDEWVWSRSADIMRAVVRNRHVAVKAAHDVSKSWTASRIAAWWVAAHPPGSSFIVTSAPSETQVKAILWREIGRAHRRGQLPGRITLDGRWYVGPRGAEELIGYGRKPQDLINKEQAMQAFSGIHAEYVLVILDEAMGIPPWLWDAAESLTTNDASRILAIGNPDSPSGRFEEVCRPGSGWHVEKISVFDSPNFTGEPVPELLNRVLVSRFGADSSTLYRDRGGVLRMIATWRKQDTHTTRKAVEAAVAQTPEVPIVVDADGLGAAVFDEMRAAGMRVAPFTMTAPVHAKRRFADRRSEMWWSFREEMEEGLIDLDPDDEDLAAQLQQPKWTMDARGRIKVETKEEMGKRGLPSPDKADACIMARFGGPSEMLRSGYRRPGGLRPEGRKMATAGLRDRKM